MMWRKKLTVTATMIISLAGLAVTKAAHASFLVVNPYGNEPVSVIVGNEATFGAMVCYKASGGRVTAYRLGTNAGLDKDYTIASGNGNDFMVIVSSTPYQCSDYSFGPLLYNGKRLDMKGSGGSDIILCGAGKSDCFGDSGGDDMQAFSAIGRISGVGGDDTLLGSSAATDRLSGGTGNDCLSDPGNAHSEFACGDGNDLFVTPASGRSSCETPVDLVCPPN
jgi:Ca2+-binding RTX toxin-like protein